MRERSGNRRLQTAECVCLLQMWTITTSRKMAMSAVADQTHGLRVGARASKQAMRDANAASCNATSLRYRILTCFLPQPGKACRLCCKEAVHTSLVLSSPRSVCLQKNPISPQVSMDSRDPNAGIWPLRACEYNRTGGQQQGTRPACAATAKAIQMSEWNDAFLRGERRARALSADPLSVDLSSFLVSVSL